MSASTVRLVDSDAEGGSQAVKAQQRLRELILAGDLPAGARIAELALVERLGMSRTPIRAALMQVLQSKQWRNLALIVGPKPEDAA